MIFKRINIALVLLASILIFTVGCNKNESIKENIKTKEEIDINPISKDIVINILRAEYGEDVVVFIEDISTEGDNYVVEVFVDLSHDEEHDDYTELHTHRESLGIHKINMYTGEIEK